MKANDAFRYPLMFENEAKGLSVLSEAAVFTIPEVIMTGEEEGQSFIILKFIESKLSKPGFWETFGVSLAKLHRFSAQRYGFTEDNYIGSLKQSNKEHNKWEDFFIEERIEKQLSIAMRSGNLLSEDADRFTRVFSTHDDERAQLVLVHARNGFIDRCVGCDRVDLRSLDRENVRDQRHGCLREKQNKTGLDRASMTTLPCNFSPRRL